LRYTQLLGRIDTYEHRVAFGLDYRAYKNSVTLVGTMEQLVPDITAKPLSLTYIGRFSQVGRDLSFNLSYSHNIPGGNKGGDADFEATRPGAIQHRARECRILAAAAFGFHRARGRERAADP
jgi:hypothetical protein